MSQSPELSQLTRESRSLIPNPIPGQDKTRGLCTLAAYSLGRPGISRRRVCVGAADASQRLLAQWNQTKVPRRGLRHYSDGLGTWDWQADARAGADARAPSQRPSQTVSCPRQSALTNLSQAGS
eukprot:3939793-Rhodomonas_salina.2